MNTRIGFALALLCGAGLTALALRGPVRPPAGAPSRGVALERELPAASPSSRVTVYVAGSVVNPGVYDLAAGSRAVAAVKAAGGAAPGADLGAVNLAARLEDGAEVLVPKVGETGDLPPRSGRASKRTGRTHGKRRHRPAHEPPPSPVDLNAAGADALSKVPGIGPSLADRIVTFRQANGRFERLDDLLDVGGMSERRLESAEPYLRL